MMMINIEHPGPKLVGYDQQLSYKNFDLSILITGSYGSDVYNYIAYEANNPNNINLSRNLLIDAMDYIR